jgi:hypothetical protein
LTKKAQKANDASPALKKAVGRALRDEILKRGSGTTREVRGITHWLLFDDVLVDVQASLPATGKIREIVALSVDDLRIAQAISRAGKVKKGREARRRRKKGTSSSRHNVKTALKGCSNGRFNVPPRVRA